MSNPVCVIVGAGEGLGQSLSAKFSEEGFDIGLISRSESGCQAAINSAARANSKAHIKHVVGDATQPESIEEAVNTIQASMGEVEVLIYNVRAHFKSCPPLDMTFSELEESLRIEVVGAYAAAKAVLPGMRQRGQGNIFFSSATAALRGSATYPLYSIGKFALRGLSQSLAKAYAKDGVHITHVRLDCDLDMPLMQSLYGDNYNPDNLANTDDVAKTYWWVYQQPKSAWSNEVELRPYTEIWTI